MRSFERGAEGTGSVSGGSAGFRACRSSASRGASTASREPRPGRPRFARLLSLGRSLKALEVRKREKAGVWPPIAARRAASPAGGAERADAGRVLSVRTTPAKSQRGMKRHDVPFEARARPSAAALARCARGADMVTRGGGRARTSVKKRDGRRLSFADPSSGRKETCRCETSGARATGLTRVRRQELWRAGGRLMWRRRLMSRVARLIFRQSAPLFFRGIVGWDSRTGVCDPSRGTGRIEFEFRPASPAAQAWRVRIGPSAVRAVGPAEKEFLLVHLTLPSSRPSKGRAILTASRGRQRRFGEPGVSSTASAQVPARRDAPGYPSPPVAARLHVRDTASSGTRLAHI